MSARTIVRALGIKNRYRYRFLNRVLVRIAVVAQYQYRYGIAGIFAKPDIDDRAKVHKGKKHDCLGGLEGLTGHCLHLTLIPLKRPRDG